MENQELPRHYNPHEAEEKWQKFWQENHIYKFDFNNLDREKIFSIDTPPPTVSGKMHMGHAFSYSQADFIARYKRMRGYNVFYPFGFDDNGLATERYVEKKIGKKATEMKRSEFIKTCLKETEETEEELKKAWSSLGISPDWTINYRTIGDHARKISQLSFIELYKQGRVYQKEAPTLWCPECQTAIAQVELEDKEIESYFNDILFELEDGTKMKISTTRPELLPACVAVFVNPDDERYKHLVGKKIKVPLMNFYVPIIADRRADPEKGTGMVMCCTFGDQTDMEWWKAYNLPLKMIIGTNGVMNEKAGPYAGLKVKEARKKIIEDLKEAGLLVGQRKIKHMVNVHERCGTEIEFLVTKQWFIKYLDLKDEFLKIGNELNWYPEHMKSRLENWIKGLQWDWCISRQRFFGVPFPVWYCKKCGEPIIADESELPVDPTEQKPKIGKCPKCGSTEFIPEKDVLDTWATSSLTPQIVLKWKEDPEFFNKMFPMDLRPQGHDIISFWAFNTIVKSYFHNKSKPWKDIMISGWALDSHGKKMSKSKGNVVDPKDMIKKYNADCLRWWAASSKLGEDLWFDEKEFINGQRFITKLWNASRFVVMNLKDYKPEELTADKIKNLADKWILQRLNETVKSVTEALEQYKYIRLRLDAEKFFRQDFCDNYLELVKDRLYNSDKYSDEEVASAKSTLYHVLFSSVKLLAPIIPHVTEEIYQDYFKQFNEEKSVHLTKWPEYSKDFEFGVDLNKALEVLAMIRKFKSDNKMPLKSEIKKLVIESDSGKITKEEIEAIKPAGRFVEVEFRKLNTDEVGKSYTSNDGSVKIFCEV